MSSGNGVLVETIEKTVTPFTEKQGTHVENKLNSASDSELDTPQQHTTTWSRIRYTLREPFAEFWGVFILVMFGDGSVAQVVLSNNEKGEYQSISWGWG